MSQTTGLISKIQGYSTKDGPGLRSTVFMMGCNLRCQWCANPELLENATRIMYFAERCMRCGTCAEIAASHSIQITSDGCIIDRKRCTNLCDCMEICPYGAYEKVGFTISPQKLAEKLLRDKIFYDQSGGGVTFSGGEPGLQHIFIYQTASLLRKEGVHVALDTAGHLEWQTLKRVLTNIDLVLYDIKAFNPSLHQKCTGFDNQLILENAQRIAAIGKPMQIRLIIVPGINDSSQDIKKRLHFIKSLGSAVIQVDILKYHRLGEGKYNRLGVSYPLDDLEDCSDELSQKVKLWAEVMGLTATVGA